LILHGAIACPTCGHNFLQSYLANIAIGHDVGDQVALQSDECRQTTMTVFVPAQIENGWSTNLVRP
jgi:hypothetical protein